MIKFKFEDQEVNLPTEWSEVTVGLFVNPMFLSGDSIQLLSVMSGIERSKLLNTTEDLSQYFQKVTDFVVKDPQGWRGGATPDHIFINEVKCEIPQDIEMERFGQKVLLGQHLGKYDNPIEAIADAIAIYLGPQIYPDNWDEKITALSTVVKDLPITELYPIADFFLSIIHVYHKSGRK